MKPATPEEMAAWTELAKALRVRRERLGMSQAQLGKLVGTGQNNVSNREAGMDMPMLSTVIRWANALDCDVVIVARTQPGMSLRQSVVVIPEPQLSPLSSHS